jgi:hypothetical protein
MKSVWEQKQTAVKTGRTKRSGRQQMWDWRTQQKWISTVRFRWSARTPRLVQNPSDNERDSKADCRKTSAHRAGTGRREIWRQGESQRGNLGSWRCARMENRADRMKTWKNQIFGAAKPERPWKSVARTKHSKRSCNREKRSDLVNPRRENEQHHNWETKRFFS